MLIVVEYKKLWLRWLKIKNCHSFPKRIFVYWKSKKLQRIFWGHSITLLPQYAEQWNVWMSIKFSKRYLRFVISNENVSALGIMSGKKESTLLGFLKQSIIGKLLLIMKDFNHILLTRRAVCLVVINVPKSFK